MTCIPMKVCLFSALLLATVSGSASGGERELREWIDAGSWSQGIEYCEQGLLEELSRRADLRDVTAPYLSRVATYCAALASGKGDGWSSGWWWYTAVSLDLKTAQDLLPELRKRGLLESLPAPRSRSGSDSPPSKDGNEVRLTSGEIVPGTPPRVVTKPKPANMSRLSKGVAHTSVAIELVVSRSGLPQQPLLVKAQALPVQVLAAYRASAALRFEPARVGGEPVEALYTLTIDTNVVR